MKIKCLFGLHKTEVKLSGNYDLLSNMEHIGTANIIVKHCKYCEHTEIELKSLRLNNLKTIPENIITQARNS